MGSFATLEWISAAYTLAMSVTLLLGSRLGDILGDVILAGVAPHQLGSASGLLESVQQLAMSLGIAAVGTVLFNALRHGFGPAAFLRAADHGLLVAIGFLVCAGVAVLWLPKHARER